MPTRRQPGQGGHLLLLRTPPPAESRPAQDPYRIALPASWSLSSVQVLDTTFVNHDELRKEVQLVHSAQGSGGGYDGVVLTSARSVDAYAHQLSSLSPLPQPPQVPFFVVGTPTATALASSLPASSAPPRSLILGAHESGTGEALAHFILDHFSSQQQRAGRQLRLLYLTGDKNRDVVPRTLAEGGISLRELQVYATAPRADLPSELERALLHAAAAPAEEDDEARDGGQEGQGQPARDVWVALFSPSSASAALSALDTLGVLPAAPSPPPPSSSAPGPGLVPSAGPLPPLRTRINVHLAAIGPVTARFVDAWAPPAPCAHGAAGEGRAGGGEEGEGDEESAPAGGTQALQVEAVAARPEARELVRAVLDAAGWGAGAGAGGREAEMEGGEGQGGG
ncbi:Uroporphyrinogen-III synthase HemD-domain-containing protein [Rhodotorula diobovata]|uniref:Uroporphyrinogen-III synthase HemD-domain-containing protein n=1 Tax=Rhodotorula diobovata TaxID=5288 RepID=A0A5C5G4I2_9BASI|nr:Uroporphyrinogen-III synthase HemD-domain-containing protein [Rhodotorula diobovata]